MVVSIFEEEYIAWLELNIRLSYMIKSLLRRMNHSAYVGRLLKTIPIFAFILVLQLFLEIHLLSEASAIRMGWGAFVHVLGASTFRSLLWASLAWALVALPEAKNKQRFACIVVVLLFSALHLLESYLLGKYGEGYTFSVVTIVLATTAAESREYLASVLSPVDFVRGVAEVLGGLLVAFWLPKRFVVEG